MKNSSFLKDSISDNNQLSISMPGNNKAKDVALLFDPSKLRQIKCWLHMYFRRIFRFRCWGTETVRQVHIHQPLHNTRGDSCSPLHSEQLHASACHADITIVQVGRLFQIIQLWLWHHYLFKNNPFCRPGHPYFKLGLKHIQEYKTREMRDKILFVDDVYQAYLTLKKTLSQPENKVYLAPPKYFLPTFDTSIVHILRGE